MLAAGLPAGLGAQEPPAAPVGELVADRPDITEDAGVVRGGWVQVETGVARDDPEREGGTLTAPGTLVRIGLGGPVEARLGWAGWSDSDGGASGAGDADVSFKVALRRAETGPAVSLLAGVSLPVGEEPFGSGVVEPEVTAIVGHDLTPGLGLGVNVGLGLPEGGASRDLELAWSSAFDFDLAGELGMFLEYFGEALENETAAHGLDGGLTLGVTPHFQLDASGGAVLTGAERRWFVGTGLAVRFSP